MKKKKRQIDLMRRNYERKKIKETEFRRKWTGSENEKLKKRIWK